MEGKGSSRSPQAHAPERRRALAARASLLVIGAAGALFASRGSPPATGDRRAAIAAHLTAQGLRTEAEDVVFLDAGRIVLSATMDDVQTRFAEVVVGPEHLDAARALGPLSERHLFGRSSLIFDDADRAALSKLGEMRTPGLHDLFLAVMGGAPREAAA